MTTATAPLVATGGFDHDAFESLLAAQSLPAWAVEKRRAAFAAVERLPLPDRRSENWMRTDLRLFKPVAWGLRPAGTEAPVAEGLLADAIRQAPEGGLAGRLTSLDGHVVREELDPAVAAKGVLFG